MKKYSYRIEGLDCANCAHKIEIKLSEQKEYNNVVLNFSTLKLSFNAEENDNIQSNVQKIIDEVEPGVKIFDLNTASKERKININLIRLIVGIILLIISNIIDNKLISNIIIILAYIVLLVRTTINAIKLLKNFTINENLLITISCIGAYLVGEPNEGAMVIILYEIGKILEEKAINNSRKSISSLIDIKPEFATFENGEVVDPIEVNIDDIIIVKPGEKVPLDGVIVEGSSSLDTSSLTGESKLLNVSVDDVCISGSINMEGLLKIKVTSDYENSTVNKVLELVENATDKKAKTETFVNKAAKIYTPIVLILAILVAILLPIFTDTTYSDSIYRALIFLVISCPCAIAISVPLSYFSGIGKASKEGILVKGSDYLDNLSLINEIIFDKTGTLTTGVFSVTKVVNYTEEDTLYYAALGESLSNHPLALSIVNHYGKEIDNSKVKEYKEVAGYGISYMIDNYNIKLGNSKYIKEEINEVGTIILVSKDDKVLGYIILEDTIKEEAKSTINNLKENNIKVSMFTGDNDACASKVVKELNIDNYESEMLPNDKYSKLEERLSDDKIVSFVGDGINDSPVLARSNIGISMGLNGSSAAIEASDVVIMTDNLSKISTAIKVSKYTRMIIKQNLIFAIGTKLLVLSLATLGLSGMWQAIFADVGVTLLTILNTLRILKKSMK